MTDFAPELVDGTEMSQADPLGVLQPRPPLRFLTLRQRHRRRMLIALFAKRRKR